MATISTDDPMLDRPAVTTAGAEHTPTTPTPARLILNDTAKGLEIEDPTPATPTQHTFGTAVSETSIPPEPRTPTRDSHHTIDTQPSLKRDGSHRSPPPPSSVGQDIEMADGEDDLAAEDDGSDNDSVTSDSQPPSKKKKGQRFFCTDFPPCQLSFTRSEHLARHIRKHTGERPFQCHCSRRFSRLDNLRQHAQTVHVNEEIPGDSLAATSTRFQRQIRTDRVRPPTSRSRASTTSSNGAHSRGHSRNLSTSSIGSTTSSVSVSDDIRRRPQPLAMATDPSSRAMLSLETYNNVMASPGQTQYAYFNQSPSGLSTPTSTAYSTGTGSPRFQSPMASPVSTVSRSSFYNGARHGRRLSHPTGPNPFQNANAATYPPPMYFNPMPAGSPGAFSQSSSVFASPTSSVFSHSRRESETEIEMRRRTWHPSTYSSYSQRPPTSGLSYQQAVDDQRPAPSDQPAASQVTRLPGIESFDHAPPAGNRQSTDAMVLESSPRPPSSGRPSDAGLHQNLIRLDIAAANAPMEGQWQGAPPQHMAPQAYMGHHAASEHHQPPPAGMGEPPVTPRRNKRQAWYGGPVSGPITPQSNGAQAAHNNMAQRRSPEDSGSSDGVPTPGTSQGPEYHPVIVNPTGGIVAGPQPGVAPADDQKVHYLHHQQDGSIARADSGFQQSYLHSGGAAAAPPQTYALQAGHDPRFAGATYSQPASNDMGRLEALVAVATSENRAVERS